MHVSGMDQHRRSLQQDMDNLAKVLASMDSRLDKQKFIEGNNNIFMIPKKFEYSPGRSDEVTSCV
jgi:SLIT-ROBO Rho GTPase activating protein